MLLLLRDCCCESGFVLLLSLFACPSNALWMYRLVGLHGALLLIDEYVSSPREESRTTAMTVVDNPVKAHTTAETSIVNSRASTCPKSCLTRARYLRRLTFRHCHVSSHVLYPFRSRHIEKAQQVASLYSAHEIRSDDLKTRSKVLLKLSFFHSPNLACQWATCRRRPVSEVVNLPRKDKKAPFQGWRKYTV